MNNDYKSEEKEINNSIGKNKVSFINTISCKIFRARTKAYNIISNETGIGVVEMILILLVLVGLVVIFRTQITAIITSVFSTITRQIKNL